MGRELWNGSVRENIDKYSFFAGLRAGLALGREIIMGFINKLIRANGVYRAADEGADGYDVVTVNVPGFDTSDATATAAHILSPQTAYGPAGKLTGAIPGKAAAVYTPATADQTIAAGQYLAGAQTVKGDANLISENIKNGVQIFGVTGTYGGGGQSADQLLWHFDGNINNAGSSRRSGFGLFSGLTLSTTQSKFGGTSLKGSTSVVSNNVPLGPDVDFGTRDFTLDFWFWANTLGSTQKVPVSFSYRSLSVYLLSTSVDIAVAISPDAWYIDETNAVTVTTRTWHHIAVVRSGAAIYLFFDGVKLGAFNIGSNAIAPVTKMSVCSTNNTFKFDGYVDELRLRLDHAEWTDDFTPPTQPYT